METRERARRLETTVVGVRKMCFWIRSERGGLASREGGRRRRV